MPVPQIRILVGDSVERLAELPDNSIDSVVCDPPYGLGKEPPIEEVLTAWLAGQEYQAKGSGFMNKKWDAYVPGPAIWRQCFRVLKPGGHLLAFFGTRTFGPGEMAIRLAGFEIRDLLAWLYGSGFPKSKRIDAAIDQHLDPGEPRGQAIPMASTVTPGGVPLVGHQVEPYQARTPEGEDWAGWGSALKPALEPIAFARKPLEGTLAQNVLKWGTGGINVDGCRIAAGDPWKGRDSNGLAATKFFSEGERPVKYLEPHPEGRWPANVAHDGSDEVLEGFPDSKGCHGGGRCLGDVSNGNTYKLPQRGDRVKRVAGDPGNGSAARFFYTAKASKADRDAGLEHFRTIPPGEKAGGRKEGSAGLNNPRAGTHAPGANSHPTVKPTALMRWLVRLVTPPGGVALDPFMGSGSTGCAAMLEGVDFVGCELDPEYAQTAEARIRRAGPHAEVQESEAPPPPEPKSGSQTYLF